MIKEFEANLEEASMIKPQIVPTNIPKSQRKYDYNISLTPLDIEYPEPYIRPIAMNSDKPENQYSVYIKGGYGTLKNPYGKLHLNIAAEDYYDIGLTGNYESFDDISVANKKYQDIQGALNMDYKISSEMTANLNLRGGIEDAHFFGFNGLASQPFGQDTMMRRYQHLGGTIGIDSKIDDSNNFGFGLEVKYDQLLMNDLNDTEHNMIGDIHLDVKFAKNAIFKINGGADMTILQGDIDHQLHHYYLNPKISLGTRKVHLEVGALGKYSLEEMHFFPDVELSYKLISDEIVIQLGATGDLVKNNYQTLHKENLFLEGDIPLTNTKYTSVYGGVRGQFSKTLEYNGKIGYRYSKGYGLFVNSPTNYRRFELAYDDLKMSFISGSLEAKIKDWVTLGGNITTNIFDTDVEEEAWHLPALDMSVYNIIKLWNGKVKIRSDLYMADKLFYKTIEGVTEKTNALVDLSVKLDITPTPAFTIFAEGYNLLDSNYERWHGYNNFGIFGLGGIKVRF